VQLAYSSTRRNLIHCARRSLRNPRTGPETRCDKVQKGQTNRVPCWLGCFSTSTAHPDLQNRYITGGTGTAAALPPGLAPSLPGLRAGFAARAAACFRAPEARRAAARLICETPMALSVNISGRAGIGPFLLKSGLPFSRYFFRRSAIIRSVRRLCRVLAPSVGKPQGVCG